MEKSVEVRVTCSHTFCAKCLTAWRLKTPAGDQKFSNDGSFLEQMRRQLAAASRIQTAWRNRAAPTPPGEPINDLRLALEAHSELKAHEARSATRKPLRPRN